ncbi:MAG: hypothetical protein ABI855_20210, partial [Bacteroidota bacterium]
QQDTARLNQKMDSLSCQVSQLQKQVIDKNKLDGDAIDSAAITKQQTTLSTTKTIQPTTHSPLPATVQKQKINSADNKNESASVFYYYKDSPKRISVEITPWINGRRKVIFYDPFGKETYRCENVRMSYTITTALKKFHDNGAVAQIEIHNNPGASMYWYETEITFDINNEPQWKTEIQKPEMNLEQSMNNKSYWNANTKQWVKQEIIHEQPVPH